VQPHAAFFVALAEEAELRFFSPDGLAALERLDLDYDNLRAAPDWPCARGDAEPGLRLAAALAVYWWLRGCPREGSAWLDRLLGLANSSGCPVLLRARVLFGAALIENALGHFAHAAVRLQHAVEPDWLMTEAEYLAFEEASETKHEFVDGHVYDWPGYDYD